MRRCVDCGTRFEPARYYHVQCWGCWKRTHPRPRGAETTVRAVPVLDASTLKAAISLAHPDVHPPERQARALKVTQALTVALEQTRALEQAA